jgi:hypothetical protein
VINNFTFDGATKDAMQQEGAAAAPQALRLRPGLPPVIPAYRFAHAALLAVGWGTEPRIDAMISGIC